MNTIPKTRFSKVLLRGSVILLTLFLASCTLVPWQDSSLNRVPYQTQQSLSPVEDTMVTLPYQWVETEILDPGWQTPPQELDGVFVAPHLNEEAGKLTYSAINNQGQILWQVDRPLSCVGFTVTTTNDGLPIIVLSDVSASNTQLSSTTASAYDLHNGEQVWGPIEVPGPHVGPGLIFAVPPIDFMGERGKTAVLDPSTGEHREITGKPIGEYNGLVLEHDENQAMLKAIDTNGSLVWSLPTDDLSDTTVEQLAAPGLQRFSIPEDTAIITTGFGKQSLVDLTTGQVLFQDLLSMATDEFTDTLVTMIRSTDSSSFQGLDVQGAELWSLEQPPEATIAALSGGILFIGPEPFQAFNIITGQPAEAFPREAEAPILLPLKFTDSGAGILTDQTNYYVAIPKT